MAGRIRSELSAVRVGKQDADLDVSPANQMSGPRSLVRTSVSVRHSQMVRGARQVFLARVQFADFKV